MAAPDYLLLNHMGAAGRTVVRYQIWCFFQRPLGLNYHDDFRDHVSCPLDNNSIPDPHVLAIYLAKLLLKTQGVDLEDYPIYLIVKRFSLFLNLPVISQRFIDISTSSDQ